MDVSMGAKLTFQLSGIRIVIANMEQPENK